MQYYDLKFYNEFYEDIKEKQWNNGELLNHYKTFGKKEGRFISENDFYEKYLSFDVDFYQHYHNDLGFCQGNKYQLMRHYDKHGVKEERKCSECYDHCDWNFYNQFYEDINEKKWNNKQLFYHYKIYGKGERRIVSEKNFYSLYDGIEKKYAEAGMRICGEPYNPPHLLFWNLKSTDGFPILSSQKNTSCMSGFSPSLLNLFCQQGLDALKDCTPLKLLVTALSNNRYKIMEDHLRLQLMCQTS